MSSRNLLQVLNTRAPLARAPRALLGGSESPALAHLYMTPRLVLHDPACWPSQRTALEHIASGKVKSGVH